MILDAKIHAEGLMQALASLKNVPLAKVVRNASRDFAQEAFKNTPTAQISKSEYYYYHDRNGQIHFLHESQVGKRKKGSKLRKVRIHKGWSKASWIGVFRALGISMQSRKASLPEKVEHISYAIQKVASDTSASTTITDYIHFDNFGKSTDTKTTEIARKGFELAAKRMTKAVNDTLMKQWGGK